MMKPEDYPVSELEGLIKSLSELQAAGVRVVAAARAYRLALEALREGSGNNGRHSGFHGLFRA